MNENILLDCESYETTVESISTIFNMNRNELIQRIENINIDEFYRKNPTYYGSGNSTLWNLFAIKPVNNYYSIAWFHLTRLLQPFKKDVGLLPLHLCLDTIWDELFEISKDFIDKDEWNYFRKNIREINGNYSYLYFYKTSARFDSGPYAMLNPHVGPIASSIGYHDYLHIPEIIEDICGCFEEKYGENIKDLFIRKSKPCIVKFKDNDSSDDYLKCALYYIYQIVHNEPLGTSINTCFDSKGKIIRPCDILSVKYV